MSYKFYNFSYYALEINVLIFAFKTNIAHYNDKQSIHVSGLNFKFLTFNDIKQI